MRSNNNHKGWGIPMNYTRDIAAESLRLARLEAVIAASAFADPEVAPYFRKVFFVAAAGQHLDFFGLTDDDAVCLRYDFTHAPDADDARIRAMGDSGVHVYQRCRDLTKRMDIWHGDDELPASLEEAKKWRSAMKTNLARWTRNRAKYGDAR